MVTMAKARSLVASNISADRASILFLRFSAEANTRAIESEVFLLGTLHQGYRADGDVNEPLAFLARCYSESTEDKSPTKHWGQL